MAINFNNVTDIMLGQNQVTQIEDSLGNVLWSATPAVEYFYVEDISGAANTLSIVKNNADAPTIEVFKSTNMSTWESMGNTDTTAITATVPANGKLYLKATANQWGTTTGNWGSVQYYTTINCTYSHNIGGNILSLLYSDNFVNETTFPSYGGTFPNLFKNDTTLVSAANLLLTPTAVTVSCYYGMFNGCTSLTNAPALPATTLNTRSYNNMFSGCTSLTTAPVLPATRTQYSCYGSMFSGCTALTTAPVLPATTLANYCYEFMFSGCTSLNSVTIYASTSYNSNIFDHWLNNVSASGDFYNYGSTTYPSGASGIPSGWTEHTSL